MSVAHETPINTERRCPCLKENCRPGQRNGPKCAAKANKEYRQRQASKRAAEQAAYLRLIADTAKSQEGAPRDH